MRHSYTIDPAEIYDKNAWTITIIHTLKYTSRIIYISYVTSAST